MLFRCRCVKDDAKPWVRDVFGAKDTDDEFTTNHREKRYRFIALSGTVEMFCRQCGVSERIVLEAGSPVVSS